MELHTFSSNGDVLLILSQIKEVEKTPDQEPTNGTNGSEEDNMEDIGSHDGDSTDNISEEAPKINMLVSSQHMRLASKVFDKMLEHGRFQEGSTLHAKGKVEIPLPDDDPKSFIILLDIIHGHTRKVPQNIDLKLFTSIAVLVDKYELHEVVEVYTDLWFHSLRTKNFEHHLAADLIPWLFITWVFGRNEEFIILTTEAEKTCDERLMAIIEERYPELPIPERIIVAILKRREKSLHDVFAKLAACVQPYFITDRFHCNRVDSKDSLRRACDNMVLGCLLRGSTARGIWPIPQPPYCGQSFNTASNHVMHLEVVALCDEICKPQAVNNQLHIPNHGIIDDFEDSMTAISSVLVGFKISDFKFCRVAQETQRWR